MKEMKNLFTYVPSSTQSEMKLVFFSVVRTCSSIKVTVTSEYLSFALNFDTRGNIDIDSVGGNWYLLTIVDEHSIFAPPYEYDPKRIRQLSYNNIGSLKSNQTTQSRRFLLW